MIKNNNGSYNKFRLSIIVLISIIIIFIIGTLIIQNVNFQKIELPSLTPPAYNTSIPPASSTTINQTPNISPPSIIINDTSTNTPTSWNWSYGGSGGSSGYTNITYVVGGGGGSIGYTSITGINSTTAPTQIITTHETPNLSQNISQTFVQILNPLSSSSWIMYLIVIPVMIMMILLSRNSFSLLLPTIIGFIIFGWFF